MSMLIRNQAMRVRMRRRHLNRAISSLNTTEQVGEKKACQETIVQRHERTGLPLLTHVEYKNGNTMYIYYKSDGSGIIDHLLWL
jgi:hypothetical protein